MEPRVAPTPRPPHPDCAALAGARLTRELAEANRVAEELHGCLCRAKLQVDRFTAENEALRKDAERYRWLRDHGVSDTEIGEELVVYKGVTSDHSLLPDELDAAIDAAKEAK